MTNGPGRRAADAPPALLTFLEQRAVGELGAFLAASPLLRLAGRGDRHPVLVLPGFTATDRSTEVLRWHLRGLGYWTHGWQLGRNMGPSRSIVAGMVERLTALHDRHGQPVSLIGQSLGGIYARHLALRFPGLVRDVITLGSPFRTRPGDHSAVEALWKMATVRSRPLVSRMVGDEDELSLSVPSTAIYSRTDGIVAWQLCIEGKGPQRESIEVRASHAGMGFHPGAVYAIADRLAQREGHWRPFRPPLALRHLYPRAATYRPAA